MTGRDSIFFPGEAWSRVPAGLPLVALLTGYRDAGSTVLQTVESLLDEGDAEIVAGFDIDSLFDYRARRPIIRVEGTQITEYRLPRLDLRLVRDSMGQQFLLLSGFEPDFRWSAFTASLRQLISHFEVSTVTWAHAIPMPVPHTRPIRLAVTGTREDLIEQLSVWHATVEAPAHALHELEFELTAESFPIVDLVVLVPHYLADGVLPATALRLIEAIGTASGLLLATEQLRERDREFRLEFESSLEDNEEAQRLISVLETQHDGFLRGNPLENPFADADGELPSADSIAAELERYLKTRADEEK